MTAPAGCQLIGRWRIVEADLWDRDYLDLGGPAMITIGDDNNGEIAFGALQAGLDLSYSPSMVFFTWGGCDEMDEVTGDGSRRIARRRLDRDHVRLPQRRRGHPQGHTRYFFNSLLGRMFPLCGHPLRCAPAWSTQLGTPKALIPGGERVMRRFAQLPSVSEVKL